MRRVVRASILLVAAIVLAGAAAAEVRRLEVVGIAPIGPGGSRGNPRDAAVVEAQKEAVTRVATEILETQGTDGATEVELKEVLGENLGGFTSRFRIVQDRGERPALSHEEEGITAEYVMVVDVDVDADRVRQRLSQFGLLVEAGGRSIQRSLVLEVRGLQAYGAYEALREALLKGAGVQSVQPLEWTRGRSLLAVESEQSAQDLLDRLLGNLPPGLEVSPHSIDAQRLELRVEWTPPPSAQEDGSGSGPTPASVGQRSRDRAAPPPVEARPRQR